MNDTHPAQASRSLGGAILFAGLAFPICLSAQLPSTVDIDLADNPWADSLDVRVRANGAGFSEWVTGLTFTIRWPAGSPATMGARFVPCDVALPLTPTPAVVNGIYQYRTYNAFGTSLIEDNCPGEVWPAGQWISIMRVKVNGLTTCTDFNIVNDAWTTANNRDFYISLNGVNSTGTIEPTPDSLGTCEQDCLGIVGGANLPGTACDDGDVCTVGDTWDPGCTCIGTYQDSDSDGTCDAEDGCPNDPNKTSPGQCGCNASDFDTDADGTADCVDGCPNDPNKINPGSCGCGVADTDTDGDGFADCQDGCPNDPNKVMPGFCGCGTPETDSDGDALPDCIDGCPADPLKADPGVCGCGVPDTDTDGDGAADCIDGCPNDPNKILAGVCGCGVADTDTDGDGTADCVDGCPADPNKTAPGVCGCGVSDVDTDGDSTPDCNDGCPNDPNKVAAGTCGCGNPEPGAACDDGNDQTIEDQIQTDCSCTGSLVDCNDNDTCTLDSFDGQECVNEPLPDTDGDGACDLVDGCPNDPNKIAPGICGCGVSDADGDGDGTADCMDGCPMDPLKVAPGTCGCGVPDDDSDSDGVDDCMDGCPNDPNKVAPGVCGCGVSDVDSDGDGLADCMDDCPLVPGQIGSPCDDGNATTTNDAINDACVCLGLPGNDPCFQAIEIPVWPPADCPANGTVGDNTGATPDAGNTLCDLNGFLNDVWYMFNSGDNQDVTIDLDPGTMAGWGIGVYAECGATELYCESGTSDPFVFNTQPNTPYLIRIYTSAWFGQGGTYGICVSAGINVAVEEMEGRQWNVYPNPNDGTFEVTCGGSAVDAELELFDLSGRSITAQRARMERNAAITIERPDLSPGVYMLRILADGRRWDRRLVVR